MDRHKIWSKMPRRPESETMTGTTPLHLTRIILVEHFWNLDNVGSHFLCSHSCLDEYSDWLCTYVSETWTEEITSSKPLSIQYWHHLRC